MPARDDFADEGAGSENLLLQGVQAGIEGGGRLFLSYLLDLREGHERDSVFEGDCDDV